jgi:predicted nucleic acid-binding protein
LRVLVDSSVWVDFFNDYPTPEQQALTDLLTSSDEICTCGVVVAEVFQGFRKAKGRARLADLFRDFTFLEPEGIDFYFRAAELYRALRRRGKTIRSTIDCVIAALAEEHGCPVLARDRDMETILQSGLLTVGRWPVEGPGSGRIS